MHCFRYVLFLFAALRLSMPNGAENRKTQHSAEEVLHHPLFLVTLKALVDGKGVHVTVAPGCALNRLNRMLRTISTSLPILHQRGTHGPKITLKDKCLIVLTCNNSKSRLPDRPYVRYFDIIYIVSEEWKNLSFGPSSRRLLGGLQPLVLFVSQSHLYLSAFQLEECISCKSFLTLGHNGLFKQRPLLGSNLSVICAALSTCDLGSYDVLLELLQYKGASALPGSLSHKEWRRPISRMQRLLRLNAIAFNVHWDPKMKELAWIYYPRYAGVCHFEQSDMRIFVKKPLPFPKSTVLILTFSSTTWIVLSILLLITICILRGSEPKYNQPRDGNITLLLVRTLMQQSSPNSDLNHYPPNIKYLLALWFLMAVILSNAFKGSLTSLLQDVPLQGTLPTFFSKSEASRHGHLSLITYVVPADMDKNLPFIETSFPLCCGAPFPHYRISRQLRSHKNLLYEVASHPIEIFMNTSFILERLCQYTHMDNSLNAIVTGPYMNQLSPFKFAVASLVRRGYEHGFFQRGMLRAEYLATQRNFQKLIPASSDSVSEEPLALADLEPYFFVWSCGLGLSASALLGEWLYRALLWRLGRPRKHPDQSHGE